MSGHDTNAEDLDDVTQLRIFLRVLARLKPPESLTLTIALKLKEAYGRETYVKAALGLAVELGGRDVAETLTRETGMEAGADPKEIEAAVKVIKGQ